MNGAATIVMGLSLSAATFIGGCSTAGAKLSQSTHLPSTPRSSPMPKQETIPRGQLTGTILFAKAGGQYGDETTYTAHADGTAVRQVTPLGQGGNPAWSPNGRYIFVDAQLPSGVGTTAVLTATGKRLRLLPVRIKGLNIGCSGAGQSAVTGAFACEGWSDTNDQLHAVYTVGPNGEHPHRVSPCCAPEGDRPIGFSPDGRKIYYFGSIAGFPKYGDDLEGSLFVAQANGTGVRRLTPVRLPVEVVGNSGGRLSPDGAWMVFTSAGSIWTVRTDGTHLTKTFTDPKGGLAITPTWSPDGKFIMFALDPPGQMGFVDNPPANALYVIRRNGIDPTPILQTADFKREPDWIASR